MPSVNLHAAYVLAPAVLAFLVTAIGTKALIPRLLRSKIVGQDVHKPGRPKVAEMGGISIFAGIVAGMSTGLAAATFADAFLLRHWLITGTLATVGTVAVIGIADDIITIRQRTKAMLPVFAALPLIAMGAGDPWIFVPGIGEIFFGWFYPLLVIPLAITGAANAHNMLGGWNGIEAGHGVILFGALSIYGAVNANVTLLTISLSGLGACLAFLAFNWFPARVFPGDVGCLTIGGTFGAAVVVGDAEFLGLVLMVPFILDFVMKARHGFPKTFAELRGSELVCPAGKPPKGLGQLVLSVTGGMKESDLVISLLAFEAFWAFIGLWLALGVSI